MVMVVMVMDFGIPGLRVGKSGLRCCCCCCCHCNDGDDGDGDGFWNSWPSGREVRTSLLLLLLLSLVMMVMMMMMMDFGIPGLRVGKSGLRCCCYCYCYRYAYSSTDNTKSLGIRTDLDLANRPPMGVPLFLSSRKGWFPGIPPIL
jgi:hypothetical protein